MAQITQEDQENAFRMLGAVLWLGNITFSVIDNDNHMRVDHNEAKYNDAMLLGYNIGNFMEALSSCKIHTGNEDIVQKLSCSQAIDTRDALAKATHANLFDWLNDRIYESFEIDKRRTGRSISIFDIYDFEYFNKDSSEQLCINYANERLQHFNYHLSKFEQEDYNVEGLYDLKMGRSTCNSRSNGRFVLVADDWDYKAQREGLNSHFIRKLREQESKATAMAMTFSSSPPSSLHAKRIDAAIQVHALRLFNPCQNAQRHNQIDSRDMALSFKLTRGSWRRPLRV
eukprot:Gb_38622 [translate_table: standard]